MTCLRSYCQLQMEPGFQARYPGPDLDPVCDKDIGGTENGVWTLVTVELGTLAFSVAKVVFLEALEALAVQGAALGACGLQGVKEGSSG